MHSFSSCIDASTDSSVSSNHLFLTHLVLFLGCKAMSIVMNSSLVHFKNDLEYLTRGAAQVLIPLMRFLLQILVSKSFLLFLTFFFLIFSFASVYLMVSASIFPNTSNYNYYLLVFQFLRCFFTLINLIDEKQHQLVSTIMIRMTVLPLIIKTNKRFYFCLHTWLKSIL